MTSIPCINVQDYGAVGDGTTDDTVHIQAALDDAIDQGQILYIPAGSYRIEAPLKIRVADYDGAFGPGPRILGAGSGHTTILTGADNGAAFDLDGGLFFTADTHAADPTLDHISVDANQLTTGWHVFGPGIPAGATVQTIVSGTEVDLSANATATANTQEMVYRFRAMLGATIQGLTIRPYGSPTDATAIRLRAGYQIKISDVHIIDMSGDGIEIVGLYGDAFGSDTCNMIELEQVRIENCAGWGIRAVCAEDVNELSFLRLQQVFIHECGTANDRSISAMTAANPVAVTSTAHGLTTGDTIMIFEAAGGSFIYLNGRRFTVTVTGANSFTLDGVDGTSFGSYTASSGTVLDYSGGMIWKGQILTLDQCAFTQNENIALFIPGQDGLAQSATLESTTFENNKRRSLYCSGIDAFKARSLQLYNSSAGVAKVGFEFTCSFLPSYSLQKIDIDGVVVRATSDNNPYTAFKLTLEGEVTLNDHRIRNVVWENFGWTGQIGFDGWTFDPIPNECRLIEDSGAILLIPDFAKGGNKVPYRQAYGGASLALFKTGPWVAIKMRGTGLPRTLTGTNDEGGALTSNTTYNVYLYDSGNLPALGLSTTAPVLDTASGYPVKSGDESRYFVGRWRIQDQVSPLPPAFLSGAAANWLNPTQIGGGWYWTNASGKAMVKAGTTHASLPSSDTDGTVVGTQS